jgi:predicted membrane protein
MEFESRHEQRRKWREQRREVRDKIRGEFRQHTKHSHVWTGLILLLIGVGALLKAMVLPIPVWVFSWQMLLIIIGLVIGLKHGFRGGAWFILILIGVISLANHFFPDASVRRFLWPMGLIMIGLIFILRPRRRWDRSLYVQPLQKPADPFSQTPTPGDTPGAAFGSEEIHREDFVDSTSIFGGAKKTIVSKKFRGGDIVNIFGGSELDLTQADIQGTVELELTQVFGGTKLIVPANWQVRTEIVAIFGGVEDKRSLQQGLQSPDKILVLTGTSIFAGIDVRSY